MKRNRAFTIIELLVVVSIIALLVGILLPAIGKARDQAKVSISQANVRNLATAHGSYGAEWNDRQLTFVNDNISTYGTGIGNAFSNYWSQHGGGGESTQHPGVILGYGVYWRTGVYRLLMYRTGSNCANAALTQPIEFTGAGCNPALAYFGSFRLINAEQMHQYVSGRFYDQIFYAPKDTHVNETQTPWHGCLADAKTLERQVSRMLADARSWQFVRNFTGQWLNLSGLKRVAVNPQFHSQFDDRLKDDMRLETQHFFAEVLRADASALQLIDSDFAMLNWPLARHYGIDGPKGVAFERVSLKGVPHRGGLLTQGAILLANSDGEQSHPIRRAVWLLDRVLGTPPAPPPPDVPELDDKSPKLRNLSIRQKMEVHRKKAACANCHRDIDPWGIAFEEYDAVGAWRETWRMNPRAKPQPVDALAELADGTVLKGMAGLKQHLLAHETDRFAKALSEKLLAYALGRSLEFTDSKTVEALTRHFVKSDYRLRGLIMRVVQSEEFLNK